MTICAHYRHTTGTLQVCQSILKWRGLIAPPTHYKSIRDPPMVDTDETRRNVKTAKEESNAPHYHIRCYVHVNSSTHCTL